MRFVLNNFCYVSEFYLRERTTSQVCVTRINYQFINYEFMGFLIKISEKLFLSLLLCVLSLITLAQNTILRLQHPS